MSSGTQQQKSFLQKTDMFGIIPKLGIDNSFKYQTKFGSFLSFLLLGVLGMATWIYGKDMYYKSNPNSITTEETTNHPHQFKIDKDNLNFCLGLTDNHYVHFIDAQIYEMKLEQFLIKNQKYSNGTSEMIYNIVDLKPRRCKPSDFGVTQEYFHAFSLNDIYCMDNFNISQFEGDWGADQFSYIEARFYPCRNTTENGNHCKPQEIIDEKLADIYYIYYTTDYSVNPKNFTNPFKPSGLGLYGSISNAFFKHIDFYYRNIFVEDNTGIVFDDWSEKRGIQFSHFNQNVNLKPAENGKFLQLLFRMQKVKYTKIYRTYLNLASVLASVGGIMKLSMLFMFILSQYVSGTYYHINIVNSLFSFKYNIQGTPNKKERDEQEGKKLYIKSFFQIIFSFCNRKHVKDQIKMLKFAEHKLGYHLNIKNILQKLMEIDKLKILLLNEDQREIFQYLEKPIIDPDNIDETKRLKRVTEIKQHQAKQQKENKIIYDIMNEDLRSEAEKKNDVIRAYKNIIFKDKMQKIDKKLIDLMGIDWNEETQFQKLLKQGGKSESPFSPAYLLKSKVNLQNPNHPGNLNDSNSLNQIYTSIGKFEDSSRVNQSINQSYQKYDRKDYDAFNESLLMMNLEMFPTTKEGEQYIHNHTRRMQEMNVSPNSMRKSQNIPQSKIQQNKAY